MTTPGLPPESRPPSTVDHPRRGRELFGPEPEPWDKSCDRRAALLLFFFVWTVYLSTASYTVNQVNDNRAMTYNAWSLATRGTFSLPEEWRGEVPHEQVGVDGQLYTDRFPGAALWAAPFHGVAEAVLRRGTPGHPLLLNYAPSGIAAATATALAVVVSFLTLRRLADRRLAVAATCVLAFGTGTWSVSADALWTHGVTHLTLALGVIAAAEGRHIRAGAAFAWAILARPHLAVVPAVVGLWKGAALRKVRPIVVIGGVSFTGIVTMSIYSKLLFGTWLPVAGYTQGAGHLATAQSGEFLRRMALAIADPLRGILIYTPFLLVLLPFIEHGWRASPYWVRSSAVGGLLYLILQMRAIDFHGGTNFFGSRMPLETLVLSFPLLLRTWQVHVAKRRQWRKLCLALVGLSLVIHALGATVLSTPRGRVEFWQRQIEHLCVSEPELEGCGG